MKGLRINIIISLILGIISFLWLIMDYLALTDIWHAEPDPYLEWQIVTYGFIAHTVFYISIFITFLILFRFFRLNRKKSNKPPDLT